MNENTNRQARRTEPPALQRARIAAIAAALAAFAAAGAHAAPAAADPPAPTIVRLAPAKPESRPQARLSTGGPVHDPAPVAAPLPLPSPPAAAETGALPSVENAAEALGLLIVGLLLVGVRTLVLHRPDGTA